jgi:hypothetical protein
MTKRAVDAGGSVFVAEDVAEGLVGEIGQIHGSFAEEEIAGQGDGGRDGAAGADYVEDPLLLRCEFGNGHEKLFRAPG